MQTLTTANRSYSSVGQSLAPSDCLPYTHVLDLFPQGGGGGTRGGHGQAVIWGQPLGHLIYKKLFYYRSTLQCCEIVPWTKMKLLFYPFDNITQKGIKICNNIRNYRYISPRFNDPICTIKTTRREIFQRQIHSLSITFQIYASKSLH